jgi:hypothetical protein
VRFAEETLLAGTLGLLQACTLTRRLLIGSFKMRYCTFKGAIFELSINNRLANVMSRQRSSGLNHNLIFHNQSC